MQSVSQKAEATKDEAITEVDSLTNGGYKPSDQEILPNVFTPCVS